MKSLSQAFLSLLFAICILSLAEDVYAMDEMKLIAKLAERGNTKEALRVISLIEKKNLLQQKNQKATPANQQAVAAANPSAHLEGLLSPRLTMAKARILFQQGDLAASEKTYMQIPQTSEYWFESLEERAHIHGRRKEYSKAIELLKTVMAAPFENVVGPEHFFVASLTSLRTCDYSGVFRTNEKFKDRFLSRTNRLKEIVATNLNADPFLNELLLRINKNKGITFEVVGSLSTDLPRNLHRDQKVIHLAQTEPSDLRDRALREQIQSLARRELKEIESVTNKLHLIEAEVIEGLYLVEERSKNREKQGTILGEKYALKFPVNDEVWLDELNAYSAQIEKCPTALPKKSKSLSTAQNDK